MISLMRSGASWPKAAKNQTARPNVVSPTIIARFGSRAALRERQKSADSVEKVDLLPGLRQNQVIGQREDSQHDGTIVERTRETVLLVQH